MNGGASRNEAIVTPGVKMQILQLTCLLAQLRIASSCLVRVGKRNAAYDTEEIQMRIIESAAAGIIAVAAQILVFATVLI